MAIAIHTPMAPKADSTVMSFVNFVESMPNDWPIRL